VLDEYINTEKDNNEHFRSTLRMLQLLAFYLNYGEFEYYHEQCNFDLAMLTLVIIVNERKIIYGKLNFQIGHHLRKSRENR